jgi:hypothetical protein
MSDFKFSTEPFLDSDQAAAILRIHPKTLQRLARCGQDTGYRIGKLWRFTPPIWKAVLTAFLPYSTPTLPSGTL